MEYRHRDSPRCPLTRGSTVRIVAIVLALASLTAPGSLEAQRTRSTAVTPSRDARPVTPVMEAVGRRAPTGPERLSTVQRVELARAAGLSVSGITSELRLTPTAPFSKDGNLRTTAALLVEPGEEGGLIVFEPDMLAGIPQGNVTARFRLAQTHRPVLVDFIVSVSSKPSPMGIYLSGAVPGEHRGLVQGDHHVTALFTPSEAGWHEVTLTVDATKEYRRLTVLAVEITVLN